MALALTYVFSPFTITFVSFTLTKAIFIALYQDNDYLCDMKRTILTMMIVLATAANVAARPNDPDQATPQMSEAEALFTVTGQQIIDNARQYLGTPYRYGGRSTRGFDCSGFTSYVYKNLNIRLNSSSRTQFQEGVSVDRDNMKVGDLVFFAGRNAGGGVGHVGIVSQVNEDGSFNFIHASCSEGVTESNSTEPYYQRRFKGARRIVADYSDIYACNK